MLKKEDVEGWNKVFTDCPIKQSDLTHPTEGFLVRALVCYVRRFGYRVEPPFPLNADSVENSKENRLFLIRLVRQIDSFLKITDKSYTFTYYDLIRPTPKRTAHTLYILLNYLFYYNMYKEEVFKMANEPIRKFQDINAAIEHVQHENAKRQQEADDLKAAIETLDSELSFIENERKEITKKTEHQKETIKRLLEQRDKHEKSLKLMQEQKRALSRKIVSDDEARELKKQIDYLQAEFEKSKLNEGNSAGKLKDLHNNMVAVQDSIKSIEKAIEIIPKRMIEQLQESNKQLETSRKRLHEIEQRKTSIIETIEEQKSEQEKTQQQYQKESQEFQVKQKVLMKTVEEIKHLLDEKDMQATALLEKDEGLEKQITEEKDIAQYLKESIADIMLAKTALLY